MIGERQDGREVDPRCKEDLKGQGQIFGSDGSTKSVEASVPRAEPEWQDCRVRIFNITPKQTGMKTKQTHVEDSSESTAFGQGFHHDIMHHLDTTRKIVRSGGHRRELVERKW